MATASLSFESTKKSVNSIQMAHKRSRMLGQAVWHMSMDTSFPAFDAVIQHNKWATLMVRYRPTLRICLTRWSIPSIIFDSRVLNLEWYGSTSKVPGVVPLQLTLPLSMASWIKRMLWVFDGVFIHHDPNGVPSPITLPNSVHPHSGMPTTTTILPSVISCLLADGLIHPSNNSSARQLLAGLGSIRIFIEIYELRNLQ